MSRGASETEYLREEDDNDALLADDRVFLPKIPLNMAANSEENTPRGFLANKYMH